MLPLSAAVQFNCAGHRRSFNPRYAALAAMSLHAAHK
jgi:hypothetical protein